MIKLIRWPFFKPSGAPRRLVRRALFHTSGKPRGAMRNLVLTGDGKPRLAFQDWLQGSEYRALPGAAGHPGETAASPVLRAGSFNRTARRATPANILQAIEARFDGLDAQIQALDPFAHDVGQRLTRVEDAMRDLSRQAATLAANIEEVGRRCRPVLNVDGMWAVPVADGMLFVPEQDTTLLLIYVATSSAGIEPGTREVVQALLQPGMRAVDAGANIGAMTLAMARAVGTTGRVDAFEPEPRLRPFLARMCVHNGLQAHLHELALAEVAGTAQFHVSSIIGHSSLNSLPDGELGEEVEVATARLDDVLGADAQIDLIKIDVEGAELRVLDGAAGLLQARDVAIVVEYGETHLDRSGASPAEWMGAFRSQGFAGYTINEADPGIPAWGRVRPLPSEGGPGIAAANIVFVRPGGAMESRLRPLVVPRDGDPSWGGTVSTGPGTPGGAYDHGSG